VNPFIVFENGHQADAANLTECQTGRCLPIVIDGGHLVLERAYLAARHQAGEEMLIIISGRFVERAPEPGLPLREHLLVFIVEFFSDPPVATICANWPVRFHITGEQRPMKITRAVMLIFISLAGCTSIGAHKIEPDRACSPMP
jgi:hypothetical protein